jgi:hypothetical protein
MTPLELDQEIAVKARADVAVRLIAAGPAGSDDGVI